MINHPAQIIITIKHNAYLYPPLYEEYNLIKVNKAVGYFIKDIASSITPLFAYLLLGPALSLERAAMRKSENFGYTRESFDIFLRLFSDFLITETSKVFETPLNLSTIDDKSTTGNHFRTLWTHNDVVTNMNIRSSSNFFLRLMGIILGKLFKSTDTRHLGIYRTSDLLFNTRV
jgi:hypothetical protein